MREFKTIEEVAELAGYHPDHLVIVENYDSISGKTSFNELQKCRLRKVNGKPCGKEHFFGFVVRSKDGSISIVGGDCGHDHFGADSLFARDAALVTNALARIRDQEDLKSKLAQRDAALEVVMSTLRRVLEIKAELAVLRTALGKLGWRTVEDMARVGRNTVRVRGVVPAQWDKDDNLLRDRSEIIITVGQLRAVALAKPSHVVGIACELQEVASAYRRSKFADIAAFSKETKQLNAALGRQPGALRAAERLDADWNAFRANEFAIVALTIRDKTEQCRFAKAALSLGSPCSAEFAKDWVQRKQAQLKAEYSVERLEPI